MAGRDEIVAYANERLEVDRFPEFGRPGLQVVGAAEVEKIACGVSASLELFQRAARHAPYELTADLQNCTLSDAHGWSTKFDVEPFRRHCLLNGLDDIGLTLEHEDKIAAYEKAHAVA